MASRQELVSSNVNFVHSVVLQYDHEHLSIEDIEDLTHEGFLALADAAARFDESVLPPELFVSFAERRVRTRIRRAFIAITRERFSHSSCDVSAVAAPKDLDPTEISDELRDALLSLNPFECWAIRQRYGLGTGIARTLAEISCDCGLSANRINAILAEAREKLGRFLRPGKPKRGARTYATFSATA